MHAEKGSSSNGKCSCSCWIAAHNGYSTGHKRRNLQPNHLRRLYFFAAHRIQVKKTVAAAVTETTAASATRMQLVRRALLLYECFHIFICIYNITWCTSVCGCVCVYLFFCWHLFLSYYTQMKRRIERKERYLCYLAVYVGAISLWTIYLSFGWVLVYVPCRACSFWLFEFHYEFLSLFTFIFTLLRFVHFSLNFIFFCMLYHFHLSAGF